MRFHPFVLILSCAALAVAAEGLQKANGSMEAGTRQMAAPRTGGGTRFTYRDPKAKAVFLGGTFNEWKMKAASMLAGADGVWTVEVPRRGEG